VAVFGAGPIGLTAIGLAVAAGAGQVVAFETSTERRQLASQLGATSVWDPAQSSPAEIMAELSKGEGFDLHVEAAGAPQITVPQMAQALAVDARVVIIGRAAQVAPMYLETFQVRRAQLYGSQGHAGHGNFPGVIRLVASGRLDLSAMISVRYPLEEAVAAYGAALEERTRDRVPLHWAATQNNLGTALQTLWEREPETGRLEAAAAAFRAALEVFEEAGIAHYVQVARGNLARAEALIEELRR